MKKAINIWSFGGNGSLEENFKLAAEAGFTHFEPDLCEEGLISLMSSADDHARVRESAAAAGIELSGLATGLYWGANAASSDPAIREKASKILERQIVVAAELGLDAILVVPGAVGVDFIPGAEEVPYDLAWDRAQSFIAKAIPLAEERGVTIAIENVWNKFLLSPLEMKLFIDSFQSKQVGSYFDVGNVIQNGYPEQWIRILGERIARVHFKDYRRAVGTVDGFVELLSGDVNWPAVIDALHEVGYQGPVAAEMVPPMPFYKHCPEVLIHNTSRAMDSILALAEGVSTRKEEPALA